ncbi:MAG: SUMF1/EgtB/PvdO family nonheme iron enzyme [Candidatus Sumerlaeota bacterium]|nr:SUMF1/EgtB/PvdO family nonheme iron enzyme [Candidatus Sumerlaeota bacterium]
MNATIRHRKLVFLCFIVLVVAMTSMAGSQTLAGEPAVGFLVADKWDVESDTAGELARKLVAATPVEMTDGKELSLERFAAIWYHQGDATQAASPVMVEALGAYVASGHGLLLSGAAVTLVNRLGVDTLQTKPVTFGNDRAQAGLIPVESGHPAFRGLDPERGVVWMSSAIYPAFAELHSTCGVALANTPGGPANPLLEYRLGRGRIIVCGWRLSPLYFHAPRGYRDNFERLIANLLGYLRVPQPWAPAARPSPGVPAAEWEALELAIADLSATFNERYPRGAEYRQRLAQLRQAPAQEKIAGEFHRLRDEALLANPLLEFDRLLLVKRGAGKLGLPTNYQSNSSLDPAGYTNEIAVLSPVRPDGKLTTLYRPEGGRFVGDVRLHFDAGRLLFSMPGANKRWQVFEINADGSGLRALPLINEPDVDNYDACYAPGGRIIFTSTAPFTGVPCVRGSAHVANLFLLEAGGAIRQLTVEQDHDWSPTVLPNGRILYLRWEYTDLPHAFSRILFHMNPDGTEQMEFYGSNSYWPASMFYAKPLPGQPTKFVAVVGGHHESPRMGDLVIFDVAKGRFEADGAVQRIPGRGRKVEPAMLDLPIAQTWPKFLHPYPLSDKYFLVSCQPAAGAPWGIYLADVFDNLTPICETPGDALLEPIPLHKTECPPMVADKVDLSRRDAEVFVTDVYVGPGLKGVPRGAIKSLRLVSYHFAYQGMGGEPDAPGLDGPWDVKQVLGTAPVNEDGSARFRVPAYTPIALQPLDADGKAVQLMRSWFTAMPGEVVSCVGCHEQQNSAPPSRQTIAATRPADPIRPWYGPPRGFDFRREVQPALDKWCVGCHAGKPRPDGKTIPDLTDRPPAPILANQNAYNLASRFTPSYYALRRLVRTPTREGDMHLLPPWEFHADTTRLAQMLRKGHHGVALDAEAWDRLITWIDLGAPAHGTWTDICGAARVKHQAERRRAMRLRYTGMDDDPEAIVTSRSAPIVPVIPTENPPSSVAVLRPVAAMKARPPTTQTIPLNDGIALELVRVPAGEFIMGQADGAADERPLTVVNIAKDFWMGKCEITNEQFALFDPTHDSRLEHGDYIQFSPGERGWSLARPRQPVVRVSWREATAFCRWLSAKTGRLFRLPAEAEWEYACRAGTTTPLWYGTLDSDFSRCANVSDHTHQAIDPFGWSGRTEVIPPWRPADTRFNDHSRVSAPVGCYGANPWGLHDMHGNVAEWTGSAYRPYPYDANDGRNRPAAADRIVVRGGSWYDRPDRCRSAFRQSYLPDQGIYDVGLRVVCEAPDRE